MIDVIDSLLAGDSPYPAAFVRAKSFWDEFFAVHSSDPPSVLQASIEREQGAFQRAMGDAGLIPPLAKDIMAFTCVGSLYDDGFADRALAERVVRAMSSSKSLSLGIGAAAQDAARLYDL